MALRNIKIVFLFVGVAFICRTRKFIELKRAFKNEVFWVFM